jgi:hypothetical protein
MTSSDGNEAPDACLGLPDDWESCCLWDGKVAVQFGYNEYGWVMLGVLATAFNQTVILRLSDAFDPFPRLLEWLEKIADGLLPARWCIDEEGIKKELILTPYVGRYAQSSDAELRILEWAWDGEKRRMARQRLLLMRVKKSQILGEFYRRLEQWLEKDYDPEHWKMGAREDFPGETWWDLRNLDLDGLKRKIEARAKS